MERREKDNEYAEWFKATTKCRRKYNVAFREPKEPSNPKCD